MKKCAKIVKGNTLQTGNEDTVTKAVGFIELIEMEWTEQVSTHALWALGELKRNKVKFVPLTNDCVLPMKHLNAKAEDAFAKLQSREDDTAFWCQLSEVTLTSIILFNRRRQGEVSRMKLADFEERHQYREEDILQTLSPFEQKLCKAMHCIEIVGKRD